MSLIGLRYLWKEWAASDASPMGYGYGNARATIFFLFLLVGTWVRITVKPPVYQRFVFLFFFSFLLLEL